MSENLTRSVLQKGEIIFRAGDLGDCAYLVERGLVEIFIEDGAQERRIGILGKGELFGQIALVDCLPRTASARTLDATELIIIERDIVRQLLEKTDPIIRLLLDVTLQRWRNSITTIQPFGTGNSSPLADQTHDKAVNNLILASDIKRALQERRFVLYYQPILRLEDQKIAGFEALIRWVDPVRGIIPPGEFLDVAEQTGQIRQIGLWTLEQACADWPRLRMLTAVDFPFVSVNVSANQLNDPAFADTVMDIMQQKQMDPAHIKLELTETSLIKEHTIAEALLHRLHQSGASWALDDFGTGYSSLIQLQNYPIGTLKVDRSFVSQMLLSSLSLQIVINTLGLAHSLSIDVVAEGVETPETFAILKELGCEYGQGWLFGKPQPLEILEKSNTCTAK